MAKWPAMAVSAAKRDFLRPVSDRLRELSAKGDDLERIAALVNFE